MTKEIKIFLEDGQIWDIIGIPEGYTAKVIDNNTNTITEWSKP